MRTSSPSAVTPARRANSLSPPPQVVYHHVLTKLTGRGVERAFGKARRVVTHGRHHVPGVAGQIGQVAYSASKAAGHSLTQGLRMLLAGQGTSVFGVYPGPVDTGYATGETHARVAAAFPAGRWGQPDDVANACLYLASPMSGYVTGASLLLHGGGERPAFLRAVEGS